MSPNYRRVVAKEFGGPDVLAVETVAPLPEPGPGEVRIRVEAAGVGYTDTIVRRGRYAGYKGGVPLTPGYDIAGVIDAVGPGVASPGVGERVVDMPVAGGYSQYLVRAADGLVAVPDGVPATAAVEVPLIWATAWQMLTRCVDLPRGASVLVVGASGSAGRALVVLAQHLGLSVIGTCSAANVSLVESLGATAIDYRRADLGAAIRAAAGGRGVAAAFDAVGGTSLRTSWSSLTSGGRLIGYGFSDFLESGAGNLTAIASMGRLLVGYRILGRLTGTRRDSQFYNIQNRRRSHPDQWRADVATLLGLLADGSVSPAEAEILPLDDAAEAHRRIAAGGLRTRLVLDPWS